MRFNRDIVAIVLLLLVFIAGGLAAGRARPEHVAPGRGSDNAPDPSIYNDRATGSKGFFDWVQEDGLSGRKSLRTPWNTLPQSHAAFLMVIDPQVADASATLTGGQQEADSDQTALAAADVAALQDWVAQGHTALLLTSQLPSGHANGNANGSDTFADALGVFVDPLQNASGRDGVRPAAADAGHAGHPEPAQRRAGPRSGRPSRPASPSSATAPGRWC